jgi:hypothetical protein
VRTVGRKRRDESVSVFSIDDPMLALITRFAACCDDDAVSEEAFLLHQCEQIREHVKDVAEDQRQEQALEWIMRNAAEYRRKWHQNVVAQQAPASRCPDCPLEGGNGEAPCEIHERWLELLDGYLAGNISSRTYVVDTLDLLRDHKEQLRRRAVQIEAMQGGNVPLPGCR